MCIIHPYTQKGSAKMKQNEEQSCVFSECFFYGSESQAKQNNRNTLYIFILGNVKLKEELQVQYVYLHLEMTHITCRYKCGFYNSSIAGTNRRLESQTFLPIKRQPCCSADDVGKEELCSALEHGSLQLLLEQQKVHSIKKINSPNQNLALYTA